jgi:hypothetical protein
MKKIIGGKRYDTEKSTRIACYEYSNPGDFHYVWEQLFVTPAGRYFLAGEGGALSPWGMAIAGNGWGYGADIVLMEKQEG